MASEIGLPKEERARRVLGVVYALAGGSEKVPIRVADIFAECDRLKIFDMSHEEFEAYRQKAVADAHALDAEIVG